MLYRTEQRDRVVKFFEFQLVASSDFLSTVRKIVSPNSSLGELSAAHSSRTVGNVETEVNTLTQPTPFP